FVEHRGGWAASAALDERDVGAAHAAALGQGVEREAARVAQLAHATGDAGVDVHSLQNTGRRCPAQWRDRRAQRGVLLRYPGASAVPTISWLTTPSTSSMRRTSASASAFCCAVDTQPCSHTQ